MATAQAAARPPVATKPSGPPLRAKVCIIGGGPGGLTAARALLDAGAQVQVYEKRSLEAMLNGPSGLGLGANCLQALMLVSGSQPGRTLAEDVAAAGVGGFRCTTMQTAAGTILKRVPRQENGGTPALGTYDVNIARPALQRALYAALPPGAVACGLSLRSFSQRQDCKVEVRLSPVGADGASLAGGEERVEVCDVLVGADGIWSRVRGLLDEQGGVVPRQPQYSGYNWYRGLVSLDQDWPGGREDWERRWGDNSVTVVYGSSGAGILYKVSESTVCFGRYAPGEAGALKAAGEPSPEAAKRHMQELCRDYSFPLRDLAAAADPARMAQGELWQMPPAPEVWGAGCVTLVGDAAHAMLPMLGQGASQAMESAVALAVTLHQASAAAGGGQLAPADLAAALRRYEAGRAPRVARVRDTADGIFFRGVGETAWGRLKRDLLYWLLPVPAIRAAGAWILRCGLSWGDGQAAAAAPAAADPADA